MIKYTSQRLVLLLILSIIGSVYCGETEVNRFLYQESQHTPEYKEKIANILEKSKQDKLNGVEVADEDMIHVHIISHSHDDVGFRKTLDQYYSGSEDMIIRAGVQYVLDETIQHLIEDPTKKFTYAEMAFFMRWWRNQDQHMKDKVTTLVNEGRLEFINGGWSMNDEAATHYEDIITNMQKGHKFLLENFGVTPNIAWHIDPFGHSNAQAALFSRMGFDAWYICRIDYRDKTKRREEKNLEFLWTPFTSETHNEDNIFVHTTYDMYWGIPNFYFGDSRAEEPIVEGYNMDDMLEQFAGWVIRLNDTFHSNHVFMPMGGDFNYQNAHTIFLNLDRLIKNFNKRYSGMKVFYSTPGEYIKSVIEETDHEWNVNKDDFFPYADDQYSYWTGFFTSRANQKGYIRQASNQLMAANQFLTLSAIRSDSLGDALDKQEVLEDAVSIAQHHDAATGTSKQAVADDYLDYLYKGIKSSEQAELEALKSLHGGEVEWEFCDVTNSTYIDCPAVQNLPKGKKVAVTVTNPSTMTRKNEVISLKVPPKVNLTVTDPQFPDFDISSDVICDKTYTYEGYVDDCSLFILVGSLNPLSTKTFIVSQKEKKDEVSKEELKSGYSNFMLGYDKISDSRIRINFGRCYFKDCEKNYFEMEYKSYGSYEGDGQKSGLYIFRDDNEGAGSKPYNKVKEMFGYMGRAVSKVKVLGDTVDTDIIVYNHNEIQSASVISRVKGISGEHGQEVTVNFYKNDFDSDKFYTDSNGMIMEERVLNHRKHYPLTNLTGFEVVSNFYPVNSAVTIRTNKTTLNENEQFTVLNDRAQSASSLHPGEIEFLIDRRTYFDDDRGVEEPLNETISDGRPIIVQTTHHVISAPVSKINKYDYSFTKKMQRCLFEEPLQLLFAEATSLSTETLAKAVQSSYNYIGSLPSSVKITTKPLSSQKVMIRIYNTNEAFDGLADFFISVDVPGIIGDLLVHRSMKSGYIPFTVTEWNLSLNKQFGNMRKINWIIEDGKAKYAGRKSVVNGDETIVSLGPQEMRTYVITFEDHTVQQ